MFLGINANQIHKWAHRSPPENGPLVSLLQRARLVQTLRHHAFHPADPKYSHYCVLTNFLNPVFDGIRFWPALEWALRSAFGAKRTIETSVSEAWRGGGVKEDETMPARQNKDLTGGQPAGLRLSGQ
jgi:ubiquitin-conjugating enzyme E2 variant